MAVAPDAVTVGVVLYAPHRLEPVDLAREAAHAAEVAARLGVPKERAFGQAIARVIEADRWNVILARQHLASDTTLLASVHFFEARPDPAVVAGALVVFAHAWLHRREHGTEPPGSLALTDMPPGPFANIGKLREAAALVNQAMLDDVRYGAWMREFEIGWDHADAAS